MLPQYGRSFAAVERPARRIVLALLLTLACMASPAAAQSPLKVVAFGDSLTAGLGLGASQAFPAQLQAALKGRGLDTEIINAGVSGDTASGGFDRLDWSIPEGTQAVIVELGANDALRGTDPKVTRAALEKILAALKARNIPVLLCGMLAPPNYGDDYAAKFNTIYPDLAKATGATLYPFFLDGVAGQAALNQKDAMHPTAEGVALIVKNILPTVEAFLRPIAGQKS